ncbi:cytochrome c oxidase assembly protein [Nocardia coubleae]|uniref:Cytochrome c oxidase assembly protein n=1 Tax=Nocardia coubleae TaxID=356147 RepID=A0A846WER7_9NOCA|nr:cytochrome c oxidase assembly protein [Nocardia coubleae]NKX91645.1 cytochrome c oxidase assembly protein [Nocardia coubleae]
MLLTQHPHHTDHLEHTTTHAGAGWLGWVVPVVAAVLLGLYLVGMGRYSRRFDRGWSRWRLAGFVSGLVLMIVALSGPVSAFAHADARGHMLQHLLIGMYAPLALVMSAPVTLLLGALTPRAGRRVGAVLHTRALRLLGHPITAAILNVGGLYVLYLTPLYAASMQRGWLHVLIAVHMLAAGYLFTWSIAGPDPAPHRPGLTLRVVTVLAAITAHAFLGKLLYAEAGRLPAGTHYPPAQMEQAAQWMYYGGEIAELVLVIALFMWWYRHPRTTAAAAEPRRPVQATAVPLPGMR